jgi:hypothetical protein
MHKAKVVEGTRVKKVGKQCLLCRRKTREFSSLLLMIRKKKKIPNKHIYKKKGGLAKWLK